MRCFYSFTSRNSLYLVMEYLDGGDLYSLLQGVGYLDEGTSRFYIAELVSGTQGALSLPALRVPALLLPSKSFFPVVELVTGPNGAISVQASSCCN